MSAATREELEALHGALVRVLTSRLRDKAVNVEHMNVARLLLRQEPAGTAQTDKDTARLHTLHTLLADHLIAALRSGTQPSASLLGVVRAFLADNGIHKDLGDAITEAQALQVLTDADLPFTTH